MKSAATTEPESAGVAYIDGRFRPIAEAKISVLDWGFSRSDVTYDVVAVVDGAFFRLADHLDRFSRAMSKLYLDPGLDRSEIGAVLHGRVALSGLREAYVEMLCTRGVPAPGRRDPREVRNRFIAYAIPYVSISGERSLDDGLSAIVASTVERIRPGAVDPTVKNFHWGDLVRGLFEAYESGAETVILSDGEGNVTEGPGFNVFSVSGGAVRTPDEGVLRGITRSTVFEICDALEIECTAGKLPADDLTNADEVFVTSTAGGIMPVVRLGGRPVGKGRTGPTTTSIRSEYWDWHRSPTWSQPVEYAKAPEYGQALTG